MRELRDLDLTSPRDLTRRQRLLVVYAVGLVSVVLAYTLAYAYGMRTLENRPRTVFRAFNFVIETMTTTGYGADSPWDTPVMNVVVATMQVTGVFIGFVTLRVLVIPLFERTPLNLDDRLSIKSDHVVVAEYQRDTEVLLDELEQCSTSTTSPSSPTRRMQSGSRTTATRPSTATQRTGADLDRASIEKASLLITDAGESTASVVLTALEANENLRVLSFTASTRRKAALAGSASTGASRPTRSSGAGWRRRRRRP